MHLEGTPTEHLPDVLGTGSATVGFAFISLSARHPQGRDAEYLEWHSLDHRPEQYRLAQLRHSIRLVSTPACRAVRAASEETFDAVDHVMTYMFTDIGGIPGFNILGGALNDAGRMAIRLPSVDYLTGDLAGRLAKSEAVAGADVIPWRPARGVYLLIEEGHATPDALIEVPGVAGAWWFDGNAAPEPYNRNSTGRRITYLFLDGDPVATGRALAGKVRERWQSGEIQGLLAAPFFCVVPFEWTRYLP